MDTIKNYLENIFARLPKTKAIIKLKEDMLNNMNDKYQELKDAGKSENEAIGIVISEFGNIDELLFELGINKNTIEEEEILKTIDKEEAQNIINVREKYLKVINAGVWLTIMAIASCVLTSVISTTYGVFVLLSLISISVGMFIYSGFQLHEYEYLSKEIFNLTFEAKSYVSELKEEFQNKFRISIIVGVVLCILSIALFAVISEITKSNELSVFLFFTCISIAVSTFIYVGTKMENYNLILQEESHSKKSKQNHKLVEQVGAVYWPLVIVGYLIWSFSSMRWEITWIVFPICGIVFGGISSILNSVCNKKVRI